MMKKKRDISELYLFGIELKLFIIQNFREISTGKTYFSIPSSIQIN